MQSSMSIPACRLKLFQDLVKQHNLRFLGDPIVIGDKALVRVDGDHLPPGGCNQFFHDWSRFTTPIRETTTPKWKRLFRRLGLARFK